jgi:hypothetical protein
MAQNQRFRVTRYPEHQAFLVRSRSARFHRAKSRPAGDRSISCDWVLGSNGAENRPKEPSGFLALNPWRHSDASTKTSLSRFCYRNPRF